MKKGDQLDGVIVLVPSEIGMVQNANHEVALVLDFPDYIQLRTKVLGIELNMRLVQQIRIVLAEAEIALSNKGGNS